MADMKCSLFSKLYLRIDTSWRHNLHASWSTNVFTSTALIPYPMRLPYSNFSSNVWEREVDGKQWQIAYLEIAGHISIIAGLKY